MSELLNYLLQNEPDFRKARLPALYSDFTPQRTLNPDGYAANIAAWKHGLASALLAGRASPSRSHFVLSLSDSLLRSLETKQLGQPLALGTVLAEAVASGEMIPRKQFLSATDSIYHKSWGQLGWGVVRWGLKTAGLVGQPGADGRMPKGDFVMVANLETCAQLFSRLIVDRRSRFERTFSKAHFRRTFESSLLEGQILSESDFDILVKYLSRDKGVLATDGNTIKIRDSEEVTITEEDGAIASLKELMEDLTLQVGVLGKRIENQNNAAQEAVRKKNRVSALAALKSKKLAEANLSKRFATLGQLEEVAAKIEQASDNVQLVKVMQSSTVALKILNTQVGSVEKVDEVLDNLREQMGEVDATGNIIAEAGSISIVDEAEVDDELETMLAEARQKEEAAEKAKREAEQEKEAEQTRIRLAELEKLGPVDQPLTEGQSDGNKIEKDTSPPTPVTAATGELEGMKITEEPVMLPAE
ncbi:Snf7-domain-containing protein [Xylariales sp. PMI_506]|nr:Snf7-domain-containing protein [Xylariales sp. PMI_506]